MDPVSVQKVYETLQKVPISQLIQHKRSTRGFSSLVAVHESTPLSDALSTLKTANILAVPVYMVPPNEPSGKVFTGIVSVSDILAWTVFQKMFDDMTKVEKDVESEFQNYLDTIQEETEFFKTRVGDLVGRSRESSESWTLHSGDPVSALLQMMTTAQYHRVLIIDDEALGASTVDDDGGVNVPPSGSSLVMVTQTDLIQYLHQAFPEHSEFPVDAMKTLLGMECGEVAQLAVRRMPAELVDPNQVARPHGTAAKPKVLTVRDDVSALNAFRTLFMHRVSSLAVVNDKGGLVANLSVSDLRGMTMSNLETLLDPVFSFLESESRTKEQIKSDQLRVVSEQDTLNTAMKIMLDSHIHRVWILGEQDVAKGVVTMTDALSVFVPEGSTIIEE